jgi:hypothetical protein
MENMIDERYRLDLIKYHLGEIEDKGVMKKFFCPLCQFNRNKNKYNQKKGGMHWCEQWNTWRYNCTKCMSRSTTMYRYLLLVNPVLARQYQRDRFHAGRTGKGFDCPNPRGAQLN